jgi:anti-sigma factor RsiW
MNHDGIPPDTGPSPEQFAAFLDGELDAGARTRVDVWLVNHPAAVEEIEGQRQVMRVWQASVPAEPSPAAWAAAFDRIETRLRPASSHRPRATRRTLWLSAGLAAAVLTAVLLTRHFQTGSATTRPPVIASGGVSVIGTAATDQEPILLTSQDDVSVLNVKSYWQDDGRVPSIGEGDVSMIVAAPLAADPEP